MDACIHIPDDWQRHSTSAQGLGFAASLHSRQCLAQMFNIINVAREMQQTKACQGGQQPHPSMPPGWPQHQDEFNLREWEACILRVITLIRNLEGKNITYVLALWSELDQLLKPSGQSGLDKKRIRLNKDDLSKMASRLGWIRKSSNTITRHGSEDHVDLRWTLRPGGHAAADIRWPFWSHPEGFHSADQANRCQGHQ